MNIRKVLLATLVIFTTLICQSVCAQTPAPTPVLLTDINTESVDIDISNPVVGTGGSLFVSADDLTNGRELFSITGTSPATLLKNIKPGALSSDATPRFANNGVVFFSAAEDATGTEIYTSSGTPASTGLLKDLSIGTSSTGLDYFGAIGTTTLIMLERYGYVDELWRSDGTTAGTSRVYDLYSNNISPQSGVAAVNGSTGLFLVYNSDDNEYQVWKTDGTTAGTSFVKAVISNNDGYLTGTPAVVAGLLYFRAYNYNTNLYEVWVSDGSLAGTQKLVDLDGSPDSFAGLGNALFWQVGSSPDASEKGLWKSLGTVGTTSRLVAYNSIDDLVASSTRLFFSAKVNAPDAIDLFVSDGTGGGTSALGTAGISNFSDFTPIAGGTILFGASTAAGGYELFKSDGTLGGTGLVKDIASGTASSFPNDFVAAGSGAYFYANDNSGAGFLLHFSDGTAGGTVQVAGQVISGATADGIEDFPDTAVIGSRMVFPGYNPTPGAELYSTDGTNAGTALIELEPGTIGASLQRLTEVNDSGAAFFANTSLGGGNSQTRLYRTDGTSGGTQAVYSLSDYLKTTYALGFFPGVTIQSTMRLGSKVLFAFYDPYSAKRNLWVSDLTAAGTQKIFELDGSNMLLRGATASTLFFTIRASSDGHYLLYRTDGSAAGTVLIADIGTSSNAISDSIVIGNIFYMSMYDGGDSYALRAVTNNSTALTTITDQWSNLDRLTDFNGSLVFQTSFDGASPSEYKLWTTSGTTLSSDTAVAAVSPTNFATARGSTFDFVADTAAAVYFFRGQTLYKSDGTSAGTVLVKNFSRESESIFSNTVQFMTALSGGNVLLGVQYISDGGTKETQLWVSDGTEAGTVKVLSLDYLAQLEDGPIGFFSKLDEFVLKSEDGTKSAIYETDGTLAGTRLVSTLSSDGIYSELSGLTKLNNLLFFSGDNRVVGQEPWSFNPDQCTSDAAKGVAGVCGCGVADVDTDADGTLDCQDLCPSDVKKTAPLVCGCGALESDTNNDGFADCGNTAITPGTDPLAPSVDTVICKGASCTVTITAQKFGTGSLSDAASLDRAKKGKITKTYNFRVVVTMSNGKVKRYNKKSSKNVVKLKTVKGVSGTSQYRVTLTNPKTGKKKNTDYSETTDFTYPTS